jgi:GSH-dependent disulfide-bond oxidoreductase
MQRTAPKLCGKKSGVRAWRVGLSEEELMIELYGLGTSNVLKVIIMLEELALPFRIRRIDIYQGDQFGEQFARLNPNRKVPVIVDPEGPEGQPLAIFESAAILSYLAEKCGRLLPAEGAARYTVLQWTIFQVAGIGPMFGQFYHFKSAAPSGNEYGIVRYQTEVRRLYDVLETRLAATPYLGGAEYSIADIATFPWTIDHDAQGVSWNDHPQLAGWSKAMAERPAVMRALALRDALRKQDSESRKTAHADVVDRVYGRGRHARA